MHTRNGLNKAMKQSAMFDNLRPPASYRHQNHLWRRLTDYVYLGVGAITIGLTENGNIGVWFGDAEKSAGSGDNVRLALLDAAASGPNRLVMRSDVLSLGGKAVGATASTGAGSTPATSSSHASNEEVPHD